MGKKFRLKSKLASFISSFACVIVNDHCKQARLSGFMFREFFKKNNDVKVTKFYVSFNSLQKRLRLTQNKTNKKKSVGNVAVWPSGYVAMWLCGYVAMWLCSHVVAMCPCGHVVTWPCGYVAMWLRGHVATWLRGYVAMWLCGHVAMWLFLAFQKFTFDLIFHQNGMSLEETNASIL
jgi:hypothetical protein